ncbi:MAG: vanadium-dependent haloperoxidase [Maribacter sp.]|uniref:vanadium-dependent haloperoxidase n=1 Tax=Maribacter sp. TaxID=1897614 RepID=UPI0032970492
MKKYNLRYGTALLALLLLHSCIRNNSKQSDIKINEYSALVASEWNEIVLETAIAEDNLLTLKGVRATAMMHLAMHDVLNSIVPEYDRYAYNSTMSNADALTAVSYAAYFVALNEFPEKIEEFDKLLSKYIDLIEEGERKDLAKTLGEASAKAVLEFRQDDRYNGEADYMLHPMAPGVYAEFNEHSGTPEGFVFGAGWATATPFMLPSASHFRVSPPPEINSQAYTEAFNEVKEVGRFESAARTDDQTHMALWWKEFVESSHNTLLRDLISKEKLNLWLATRAYALLNMAIYDGYVNVFDNKFYYNHWRPYTAIRWAANDDNPYTEPDLDWNNLHKHTYPFPSYPSAHGTASTAAMTVLANTLGKGDTYAFTMVQKEVDSAGFFSGKMRMNPPTRSFNSFSEAGLEASMSRIYLGIHFRYDSEEGHKLGAQIGNYAVNNFLQPRTD